MRKKSIFLLSLLCFASFGFSLERFDLKALYETEKTVIIDIDQDNRNDIVAISYSRKAVLCFLQEKNGKFKPSLTSYVYKHSEDIQNIYVANFDEDNYPDILVVHANRYISFLKGTGGGTFTFQESYEIPFNVELCSNVCDVNQDGNQDLFVTTLEFSNNTIPSFTFINTKKGKFPFEMKYEVISFQEILKKNKDIKELREVEEIHSGHFNNDTYLDLCFLDMWRNRVFILYGNGKTFTPSKMFKVPFKPYSLSVIQLNNDKLDDLFISTTFPKKSANSYVFLNKDGVFNSSQQVFSGVQILGAQVGNFLSSEKKHLALASNYTPRVMFFAIDKNGNVEEEAEIYLETPPLPAMLAKGRLNNDNLDDLVTPNDSEKSNSISIILSK